MPWKNASHLVLYHGTVDLFQPSITAQVDLTKGQVMRDFSRGFYTTTNAAQAMTHARNLRHRLRPQGAQRGAVARFVIDRDAIGALSHLAFVEPTADFWDLIDWCRAGMRSHHTAGYYDVVYGPVTEDYRNRTTHARYDQVSFHTPGAVKMLGVPQQWSVVP
jgi:hypothetical protein